MKWSFDHRSFFSACSLSQSGGTVGTYYADSLFYFVVAASLRCVEWFVCLFCRCVHQSQPLLRPLPFAPVLLVSIVRWGNFVCNCHDVDTLRLASTWKLSRKGLPSRAWRAKQQTCCLERRSSKLEKGRFQSEPPRGCPWLV